MSKHETIVQYLKIALGSIFGIAIVTMLVLIYLKL